MSKYYEGQKTLYDLGLHEILCVETNDDELWTSVMRVPGGFIYRGFDKSKAMMSNVFVPYNNEFFKESADE